MSAAPSGGPVVETLTAERFEDVVDVLTEAFEGYPVMRFVIGEAGDAYAARLRTLIRFFVEARLVTGGILLGVPAPDGALAAAATIARPGAPSPPPAFEARREALWMELGADARARYERYGTEAARHPVETPHYHLSMIGVRRAWAGRGLARRLLDALHRRSADDPRSAGVSLNTELPRNVALYEHFGYEVLGRGTVGTALEVWSLFRPDGPPRGRQPGD